MFRPFSLSFICRIRNASSRASSVSRQVLCGLYLPGGIGIKSLIGWPKMHVASESLVSLSGAFLYWSIARWNAFVSRLPSDPVLSASSRFIDLPPISDLQLLYKGTLLMTVDGVHPSP